MGRWLSGPFFQANHRESWNSCDFSSGLRGVGNRRPEETTGKLKPEQVTPMRTRLLVSSPFSWKTASAGAVPAHGQAADAPWIPGSRERISPSPASS